MHRTCRMPPLRMTWLGLAALVLSFAGHSAGQDPVPVIRPNIVLIIADDLGAEDSGPYGSKAVRTPNLDRMARDGMRFTRAFNTCSSCSPSRSSIITGRYPHNTGAERLHMPLPKDRVTFVEKLKKSGYWTAAAGKWHLGPEVLDRFDVVHEERQAVPDGNSDGSGCTYWLPTLLERPRDKPFFLWLASHDPHRPYFEGTLAVPHQPEEAEVPPYLPDFPPTRKDLAMYYDEVGRLDAYVGKLLAELERQSVLDRTAIFFITDNGRPFPRCKTSVYDSGIQSPFLVYWPGHAKPGSTSASLISSVDIAPTLLELAGLPAEPTFQGKSLARLLADPSATIREQVFAEHNWHDFSACERAVRNARFKYIRNFWPDLPGTPPADAVRSLTFQEMRRLRDASRLTADQLTCFIKPRPAEELYDVEADPQELKNLASDPVHAATLKQLRAAMDQWRRETADFEPSPRPPDTFDRETGAPLSKARKKALSKSDLMLPVRRARSQSASASARQQASRAILPAPFWACAK
jgi:N-sulfoglucosamine sulfohydrolase